MRNWVLPEYIEDILPAEAQRIESMRRQILDLLLVHGYQLVTPPMLEFVESLTSGSGSDMNLRMFKMIDQLSGRMIGLRPDITPQTARIDAHLLNCNGITRLCYAGSVLHTIPTGITSTREPFQIGGELYGHIGIESDLEIQRLMLQALAMLKVDNIHLDLGHVAIFRSLVKAAKIPTNLEIELFNALQAKDIPSLQTLCSEFSKGIKKKIGQALMLLPKLYGDKKILTQARNVLPNYPEIRKALDELEAIAKEIKLKNCSLAFDLSDLRGYHYHTGIVFSAYTKDHTNAIALGGRFDEIGKAFGRARPATGFSMDLRELLKLNQPPNLCPKGILAPYRKNDKLLEKKIAQLRKKGKIVIIKLPGQGKNKDTYNCDKKLVLKNKIWEITTI
ncbi:MAG: ATP phosphoribosyltransferase regulatory subunit [Nitrosomonadaceae bacterium]|nr:ATP phosphoribosyltransferase regulatory subunit [Nitrosomonadaceae bacterium]|tara:strand:- start:1534 stop:2706 length:1173 start_codon:yes stop_codon:yes gene_type:complete